jgi:hypothetical protein
MSSPLIWAGLNAQLLPSGTILDKNGNPITGSGGPSFNVHQPITGTSPTADATHQVLTYASSDGSLSIAGNSATNTMNYSVVASGIVQSASYRFATDTEKATWNAKQAALGYTAENTANKNVANGYAGLNSSGKLITSLLPNAVMTYKGTWDASTNTPTLADGTGTAGDTYSVSVGATRNLGSGAITFTSGSFVIYNGTVWQYSPPSAGVSSVNGYTGAVVLVKADVGLGSVTNDAQLKAADLDVDGTLAANSDTKIASQKATKTYVDTGLSGKQASLGFTAENSANKDTDGTLAANSDVRYASQKAIKTYVDTGLAGKISTYGSQTANFLLAGPTTGAAAAPTFRALVTNDLPTVPETKGGTNQTTYSTGDSLQATAANTMSKLPIGSSGQVKKVLSTGIAGWRDIVDISAQYVFSEELGGVGPSGALNPKFSSGVSGTAADVKSNSNPTGNGTAGVFVSSVYVYAGTTSTGYASMYNDLRNTLYVVGIGAGKYETVIKILNLSKSTDRFIATIGLAPGGTSTAAPTDGIYFTYSDNVNTGKWQFNCANASTVTTVDTGITASTSVTRLGFTLNAAGTSVQAVINGTNAGTAITTNIPGSNTGLAYYWQIRNTAYTSQINLFVVASIKMIVDYTTAH